MGRPQQYLCKNREGNCPNYVQSAIVTVGGAEKFVCPLGLANCEREWLDAVSTPEPPWKRFAKRASIIVVPAICVGLVWLYVVTRPPPPFTIAVSYTSPLGAKVHPGGVVTWKIQADGGKPSAKPRVTVESLSPEAIPNSALRLETSDLDGRKYTLTAQLAEGATGVAKIKISISSGKAPETTTNLVCEIPPLGPPSIAVASSPPFILESNRASLTLSFTVSDEKANPKDMIFSATADPGGRIRSDVESDGGSRTVTLTRNEQESGPLKLVVRLATPDGRETNQSYDVTISPLPPPVEDLLKAARKLWFQKKYAEAISKADEALAIDRTSVEAYSIKAGALYSEKHYSDSLAVCSQALGFHSQYPDIWFTKGADEEALQQYRVAAESYESFLKVCHPADPRKRDVANRIASLKELVRTNSQKPAI
jgi:hypothetical protein